MKCVSVKYDKDLSNIFKDATYAASEIMKFHFTKTSQLYYIKLHSGLKSSLIGRYHNRKRISELNNVALPIYKNFIQWDGMKIYITILDMFIPFDIIDNTDVCSIKYILLHQDNSADIFYITDDDMIKFT